MMSFLLVANIGRRDFGWFFSGVVWFAWALWRWFGGFSQVANAVYRRWVFFPPPLSLPLPFLLFPFFPHLCVRCERFSVLPPTRAIQDHLRCLAADAGRTRAQLLGDERSGSLRQDQSASKRAMRSTAVMFLGQRSYFGTAVMFWDSGHVSGQRSCFGTAVIFFGDSGPIS
jgi:hypothetical protein